MDPRRRVSRAQEKGVAKRYGAKQHAGSGSGAKPQDMHTDDSLIECKTVLRGNRQITIKEDDWKQLRYHAAIQDKSPVLHIELGNQRLVLIPEDDHRAESLD
jgi:hypothetical protein